MTDRNSALVLTLAKDVREDDPALLAIKAVLEAHPLVASIEPVVAGGSMSDHVAVSRAKQTIGVACIEAVTRAVYAEQDRTL